MVSIASLLIFANIIFYTSTQILEPKVVIIGAGPAGLAAATKLLENGIDVSILEAEARIGGRIRTVEFADGNIELGAHACHGEKGNVVFEMVKDLNLLESNDMYSKYKILASNNTKIDERISENARRIFFDVTENWDDVPENLPKGDYFLEKYIEAVIEKFPNNVTKQNEILVLFSVFKHSIMSLDGTNDWNDASAANDYKNCEGDYFVWKNHGYKLFLDVLMKKYPKQVENFNIDSVIHTGKVVEKIIWDDEKVVVTCHGGDELKADYVIFTPSLGVLKAKHMDLFTPNLPDEKVKAIESKGYGSIGIMSAHFPEAWWGKNFTGVNLLWLDEPIEEDKSWLKDVLGIFPIQTNVLEMWISGKNIAKFENTDVLVLIDAIDEMMRKFFDNSTKIVKADNVARSDWLKNPNFRGVYSYETIESRKIKNPSCVENLIQPLFNKGKPVVLFAGEATHPYYYSTVHGAVETGWREAQRIIDHINLNI